MNKSNVDILKVFNKENKRLRNKPLSTKYFKAEKKILDKAEKRMIDFNNNYRGIRCLIIQKDKISEATS